MRSKIVNALFHEHAFAFKDSGLVKDGTLSLELMQLNFEDVNRFWLSLQERRVLCRLFDKCCVPEADHSLTDTGLVLAL